MIKIKDYEDYAVTENGEVYSYKRNRYLKVRFDAQGYADVCLTKEGKSKWFRVHRLVAAAYVPNPNNYPLVNHKDENPSNNHFSNLEWCTKSYNINYGTANDRRRKASSKPVFCIELNQVFDSAKQAEQLNYAHSTAICGCCQGKQKTAGGYHWQYVNQ